MLLVFRVDFFMSFVILHFSRKNKIFCKIHFVEQKIDKNEPTLQISTVCIKMMKVGHTGQGFKKRFF